MKMNKVNKELLDAVINDRLKKVLDGNNEKADVLFDEAMEAIDRKIELTKMENSFTEQTNKVELEREKQTLEEKLSKGEGRRNVIIRCIEIGGTLILAPIIDTGCKKVYAKMICEFEKDYTFTTTAGKTLSGLFRFKK